jgi:hypothetical protein
MAKIHSGFSSRRIAIHLSSASCADAMPQRRRAAAAIAEFDRGNRCAFGSRFRPAATYAERNHNATFIMQFACMYFI